MSRSGGDEFNPLNTTSPPAPQLDSPLRRRAQRRAERAAYAKQLPVMPPVWVIVGCVVVPLVIVLSGYLLKRATRTFNAPTMEPFQLVTPTAQPVRVVPVPFYAWLTATHPAPITSTPGFFAGFIDPLFASATPGFSLGNSMIAYSCFVDRSDEICVMNADGRNQRQLTFNSAATDWYPSFSPDGRTLLWSSQMDGHFDLYSMDLDGKNVRQITHNLADCYAPSLSPDGTKVVFASTFGGVQNIWTINFDGTNPVQLTHDPRDNVDPVWSPDGTRISFTTTRRGDGDLMVMNANGSNVRRVTNGINVEGRNSWSPDGRYFTFYAGPAGDKDIYVVGTSCISLPDGCGPSQMRKLTSGGNNKGPDFSPDGQWITFASELDKISNEVFIVRVDGTELHQLTFDNHADWQPRWGWHP